MRSASSQLPPQPLPPSIPFHWALLIAVPLAAMLPALGGEFLTWDDWDNIAKNPAMLAPAGDSIGTWWTQIDHPYLDLYIPLTYTVWRIIAEGARLDSPAAYGIKLSPAAFHLDNLLLHAAATVLAYLILRRLIKQRWAAVFGALLFATHPIQVEAVAWITGMKDVLSGALSLAAIYLIICFVDAKPDHPLRRVWYALATLTAALAMLAKPSAAMVPIVAAVLIAFNRIQATGKLRWRDFIGLAPWLAMAVLVMAETLHAQPAKLVEPTPLWSRPLIAGDALAFYLQKLAFPIELIPDYGRTPTAVLKQTSVYVYWIIPIVVATFAIILRRRLPHLLVGVAIIGVTLAPVLGLVPFSFQLYSTVADRFMYLGMLGVAIVAAGLLDRYWSHIAAIAGAFVIAALVIMSFEQARLWHDTTRLCNRTLEVNLQSFVSHGQLAYLAALDGNDHEAANRYAAALQIRPQDVFTNYNWGNMLLRQGKAGQAIERYQAALASSALNPAQAARIHSNCGVAYMKLQQPAQAQREFELGADGPDPSADALANLGLMMFKQGNFPKAQEYFERALAIDPNQATARKMLQR